MSVGFPARKTVLLWVLFLVICFGLGYPILNRYDPGKIPGTSDAADYCRMVQEPLSVFSYRPLVPALAKPFYWIAQGRAASWNPALFGMLAAASVLTAATAVTLIAIGLRCGFCFSTSLVGALLFLVNFAVPNWNLAAYIDSGEAFFLALVVWSLLSVRWYLLPFWAIPGSLSKETFAPFAFVFAIVWWLSDRPLRPRRLGWIAALGVLACLTVLLSFSSSGGIFSGAAHYTTSMAVYTKVGFFNGLLRCLKAHELWYTFLWLLPLGLWRLNQLDRRWVWAASSTFVLALLFGAYNDALGNTARALFNIAGPLLSLSAAALLTSDRPQTIARSGHE
ncbi:MAG: hypothetical protein ACLQG3_00030 [Terracidiphilus sp.]